MTPSPWIRDAKPLLLRLGDSWQDEQATIAPLTLGVCMVERAIRGGFVQRRRNVLTRRYQLRLVMPDWQRCKVASR